MDIKKQFHKASGYIKKYRYVVLILAVGFILMAIPETKKDTESTGNTQPITNISENTLENRLSSALSQMQGAGRVEVILTISEGEKTQYQTNGDVSVTSDQTHSTQTDTVTVTDAERNQTGLISQIIPPVYQGAIVLCQGADSPSVRLAVTEAVSKATGLGADHISVLKMKQ